MVRFLRAEQKFLNCCVVGSKAIDRQISARRRILQALRFRLSHTFEQRDFAVVVVIDADAEIDLLRVLIRNKSFRDAENRIGRSKW